MASRYRCPHGKARTICAACGGSAICPHGVPKYGCRACNGSSFCEHGRYRRNCTHCSGWRCEEPGCPRFGRTFAGSSSYNRHWFAFHLRLPGYPRSLEDPPPAAAELAF